MNFVRRPLAGYLAGGCGVSLVALVLWPFYPDVRALTAASSLLIVILLVAVTWGMAPAVFASALGALYLNFFYVPPLLKFDFHIDGTEDIVGLATFLVTAVTVGQLSSKAQQRARQVGELYQQLKSAFDRASELEGIKRSEQFKSALLDTVTHDLRTPLTSIKAAASALIDARKELSTRGFLCPPEEHLLGIIVKQSDVLNRFIEGMIELAEIESKEEGSSTDSETTPMEEIILAALARAEEVLQGHDIQVECDQRLNRIGRPRAVAQVLFSLLENAGKYSPAGTTIRVAAQWSESGEIQVSVEDQGPGVPLQLRSKVFEKFFRGKSVERSRTAVAGLGLGLAIARRIIEFQDGEIWVEDRTDGKSGARFVFRVPAQACVEVKVA